MRRFCKYGALILAAAVITAFTPNLEIRAETQLPETIKVGLFYNNAASHTDTDVSSFTTNAANGLIIGFFKDGAFSELLRYPGADQLTVRKDAFFVSSTGKLFEYDPSSGVIPAGEKTGPYHVKIGQQYVDYASALAYCQALIQMGIAAFPVYSDSWQVWTGFYSDEASALADIANRIQAAVGAEYCGVVAPSADRIVVSNLVNNVILIFGSSTAYFRIMPAPENNPSVLAINGTKYRGSLEVRRLSDSDMTVINVVKWQEYLYGNVPPEIGASSHPEALKAQALASKMYALNNIGKHGKTGFDICATTHCQVYRGFNVETDKCNAAIDEIKDKLILYNGTPAKQIFYFASGGGSTEDSVNVWGYAYPYLKSVIDNYEPIYNWTKTLRSVDIKQKISSIGNITGIDIAKTSPAGRVTELVVRGDNDRTSRYTLEKSRTVLGLDSQLYTISTDADVYTSSSNVPPSKSQLGGKKVVTASGTTTLNNPSNTVTIIGAGGAQKTVKLVPEVYTFTGKGWGHAVGMSQEGARSMAKAGIKYDDIIKHYFVGTTVQ